MEKMISRLETILEKYEYLQNKLQEDEVINDIKQYTTYSKELAMLEKSAKKCPRNIPGTRKSEN